MGNNNYQFRLQRLEILDKYIMALTKEKEHFNTFQFGIVNLHEDYAGSDEWNDVKHTRFKDEHAAAIQLACQSVNFFTSIQHLLFLPLSSVQEILSLSKLGTIKQFCFFFCFYKLIIDIP